MSLPQYTNVRTLISEGMSFEKYLRQISLLYPNLPELYETYVQKMYKAANTELARSIEELLINTSQGFTDDMIEKLERVKNQSPDDFDLFLYQSMFKYKIMDLLDIQTVLNATVLYDLEMKTSPFNRYLSFVFTQPRESVYFVTFSSPFERWEFIRNENNYIVGVQVEMQLNYIDDVTMICIVGGVE